MSLVPYEAEPCVSKDHHILIFLLHFEQFHGFNAKNANTLWGLQLEVDSGDNKGDPRKIINGALWSKIWFMWQPPLFLKSYLADDCYHSFLTYSSSKMTKMFNLLYFKYVFQMSAWSAATMELKVLAQ